MSYHKMKVPIKHISFLLAIQFAISHFTFAQVIPKGMTYQAIARNAAGDIMSNHPISIRINLLSVDRLQKTNHYSEIHSVTTNETGLFNVVIGEGNPVTGQFGLIPWNEENIWMEVSVSDKDKKDFVVLNSSRLMAVPYAIHAARAHILVNSTSQLPASFAPPEPGVISTEWSVLGNAKTDASGNIYRINSLGTTDFVDVIMITDNVERLRILPGGDIITKLNFEIGKNLNVLGNTGIMNTLTVGDSLIAKNNVLLNTEAGSTINYGPFTVANLSPTLLTGILLVDKATTFNTSLTVEGPTDLNNLLNVTKMSPTKFTGTLLVDKTTNLNDAVNVNNMSPTYLSGTLVVEKSTTLNDSFTVLNMSPALLTGTLEVDKIVNLNDSLSVNNMSPTFLSGTLLVEKEGFLRDNVIVSDSTQSISTSTGAVVVDGGFGLGKNLNVGGSSAFAGPVTFNSPIKISDTTQSTSTSTGALKVSGGVGLGKNINVGGDVTVAGMTTLADTTQSNNVNAGALKVAGGAGIGKNLQVGGMTTLTGMTSVTNITGADTSSIGALRVLGGTGIGLQLNVGGKTTIEDATQSNSAITGALKVTGGVGIAKQLNVRGMTSILDVTPSSNSTEGALKVAGGLSVGLQLNVGGMTSILSTVASTNPFTGALKVGGGVGVMKNMHVGTDMSIMGSSTLVGGAIMNGTLVVTAANNFIAHFKNTTNQHGILIKIDNNSPNRSNNFVEFKNSLGSVVGRIEGENASEYMSNPTYIREISALDSRIYLAELLVAQSAINLAMAVADLAAAYSSATGCAGVGACVAFPIPSSIALGLVKLALRTAIVPIVAVALDDAHDANDAYLALRSSTYGITYESGAGDYAEWLPKSDPNEKMMPGLIVGMKNGRISKKTETGSKLFVISTQPIILGNMQSDKSNYEKVAFMGQVPVQVYGKVSIGDYILPSGLQNGLGRAVAPKDMQPEDFANIVGVAWSAAIDDQLNLVNVAIGLHTMDISKVVIDQNKELLDLEIQFEESNAALAEILPGFKSAMGISDEEILKNKPLASTKEIGQSAITTTPKVGSNNFPDFNFSQFNETLQFVEKVFSENGKDLTNNAYWSQLKTDPGIFDQFVKNMKSLYPDVETYSMDIIKSGK